MRTTSHQKIDDVIGKSGKETARAFASDHAHHEQKFCPEATLVGV